MLIENQEQPALVGAILSRRFRLERVIGEGGMGTVYAAVAIEPPPGTTPAPGMVLGNTPAAGMAIRDAVSGTRTGAGARVAIKVLKPEFLTEPQVLSRFLEEGRTCQRLIHPNILRVFESATAEDGSPYIVMELLEGVPLSAYTANGGRVPPQQAVTILQGMLAGLAAAHAQGVIHRDLKPENVFLAREPSGQFQVKLLDFGIAKVMDAAGGMGSKTKTGMLLGTPAYMSPEQIKNAKDVDTRTDIWSAGVMGYEMLSGRVAFPAPTEYARLTAVLMHDPEPLERIDPSLAPLAGLVARAMRKNREERFTSALEMARALSPASASSPPGPDAEGGRVTPAHPPPVSPLSRLPDVPSLYEPLSSDHSPAASSETHTRAAAPAAGPSGTGPLVPIDLTAKPTGGTLPSAPARPDLRALDGQPLPSPVVVVGPPQGSTMPSKDLPMLGPVSHGKPRLSRGIEAWVVVVLVLGALLSGFLLGFAVARSM